MHRGEKQPLVKEPRSGGPHGFGFQSSLYTRKIGKIGYTFVVLLVVQLVLGIMEFFFAVSWGHVVGLISSVILVALAGIHFHAVFIKDEHSFEKKKRFKVPMSILNGFFTIWVFLLVLTHILGAASENQSDGFPTGCKLTTNCVRLASNNSINSDGLEMPVYTTDVQTMATVIDAFFDESSLSTLIETSKDQKFIRWRTLTKLFAFPDDTFFRLSCTKDKKVMVEIQAQARLGRGDFGVNRARVEDLLAYLKHAKIDTMDCVDSVPIAF
jgi:uncharacterized protein (DUF1499 family)